MDFNILDQRFIDHVKSAHVVIQRMAPYNMDLNVPFLNNMENDLHLTSLGETKYATKYFVEKLYSKINWNGFNEKFVEHMVSAYVVMDCFKCKECDAVFHNMREYYLHLASHVQRTDGDVSNDRFVKLYSCDKCDKKFVQKSTLDMHMAFHDPFPHNCDCGIGFYLKSDLLMHKELVHPTIFKAQFDKLTCRKQRALKNEYWGTAFEHRGPDTAMREKKEEHSSVRSQPKGPRLRAEPVVKSKTKTKSKQPRQWKIKLKRGKHPCDACGKEFSQRANLKRHARTHEPPTLGCPECGKMFRQEIELQVHQRTHSGERPYQCHLCRRRFTQSGALQLHLQRHAGLKPFACDACGKRFLTRDSLARHLNTHSGAKPYACSHCGKAFADPSAHRRHERTHSGVKPYACDFCGMRFSDASGRIAHEKRHMADRRHRCAACDKRFYSASELRKHHVAVHTPHRPFQCDLCSKSFALKQYVDIHIRDVHSGAVPPLRCDGCDFRTLFKSNLAIHMRRHMAMPKKYRCEDCGMRFYSRTPMERHRDAKHRRLHRFECDDCGARFTTKGELFRHVVNVHMDVRCDGCSKRFCSRSELERHRTKGCVQCDICRVKFPSNRRLNLHRPTHFAAKHPCPICFKMFKRVATLNRHYADVHSEEKNFECFYCGGKFALKSILRSHIYKEHAESMYCHICKREFYSDSDLKRHKSKGCKGKPLIPCEICDKLFKSSNGMRVHLLVKHAKKYVECDHCQSRFGLKSGLIRHIRGQHKHVMKTQHRP